MNQLFTQLKNILVIDFELPESEITLDTNLFEELDLDSIDAVDLMVKLRETTGLEVDPDTFKQVRTVRDVISELSLGVDS